MKIRLVALIFSVVFASLVFNSEAKAEWEGYKPSSPIFDEIVYLEERGLLLYGADIYDALFELPAERRDAISMIAFSLNLDKTSRNTVFSDIPKESSESGLIQSAFEKGIVTGYKDGTFRPNDPVTRGQFAAFIDRAYGKYLPNNSNIEFKDVPKTLSSHDAIKKLAGAGIATGYKDGTFKPNETLTKEDLATFMYRTVKYLEGKKVKVGNELNNNQNSIYNDSDIKRGMSYDSVYKIVKNNVTYSSKNSSIFTNKARYGLSGTTHYFFDENNELNFWWHKFDWSKEENTPNTVSELHKMYLDEVKKEFGIPDHTFRFNSIRLTYLTDWKKDGTSIELSTTKDADGEVKVQLQFFGIKKD